MKLLTKQILLLLACITFGISSAQNESNSSENEYHFPQDDHYLNIKIGGDYVQPIGSTFTGDNLESSGGFNLEISFNLFETSVLLGARYSNSSHDVIDKSLVGNYSGTFNSFIGGFAGYQFFSRQKIRLTPSIGVGHVTYRQSINSNSFRDSGTTLWINGEVSYNLSKWFALYGQVTSQNDYLHMDVPTELEEYFKSGHFLRFGLGVKFVL